MKETLGDDRGGCGGRWEENEMHGSGGRDERRREKGKVGMKDTPEWRKDTWERESLKGKKL